MLTREGALLLLGIVHGSVDDSIRDGQLAVSDGSSTARAGIDSSRMEDGLVLEATFGEREANFAWRERLVISRAGVVVDRESEDLGRKAEGAVWVLTTVLRPLTTAT